MTDPIEQLARALAAAQHLNHRRTTAAWADLTDAQRNQFRDEARRVYTTGEQR